MELVLLALAIALFVWPPSHSVGVNIGHGVKSKLERKGDRDGEL